MIRRLRYGAALAGTGLVFCLCLVVLRVWQGSSGYDVYYYALQTKALSVGGRLLFEDSSPVYGALWLVNLVVRNPVLSVQVLSSLSIAALFFCLLLLCFRGKISLYKISAALIVVFNPGTFYLLLEFAKNSFAFALFFLGWILLTNSENRLAIGRNAASLFRGCLGLLLLGLSAFSHRMMLAIFVVFCVHQFVILKFARMPARMLIKFFAVIVALLMLAGVVLFFRWDFISERLGAFYISAPLHRMVQLIKGSLLPGERVFYLVLQIAVFLGIPFALIKYKHFLKPEAVFAGAAWLFVFPFLHFSWDEIGLRLLILAPLMLGPWLISLKFRAEKFAAVVFLGASVWFFAESAINLTTAKGPDYRSYRQTFASLGELVKGKRLIAHRGLSGFLWYEMGIRSENFLPEDSPEKYLRLVYAFSPDILNNYLEAGDPLPVRIDKNYTLVEEFIWRRFAEHRGKLRFLKSELNPFLPRPASAFVINEEVSTLLSPEL